MDVAALTESTQHVCYRYRLRQFVPLLALHDIVLVPVALPQGVLRRWRQIGSLNPAAVAVLQRRLLDAFSFRMLRRRFTRLVYDFDDAVNLRDKLRRGSHYCRRRAGRFRRTVAEADIVIAGNHYLAGLAYEAGAERVTVIPTCVDVERYRLPPEPTTTDRPVRIVWIGSRSTLRYLEPLRPVFEWLARVASGWVLRIICNHFPDWPHVPIEKVRWSEQGEVRALMESDIGVAPLPDDPWTRGKCGLKLLQYMAAGLPVVASPVGVQRDLVLQDRTGFFARTKREWADALGYLMGAPEARRLLGMAGRARCESRYDIRVWGRTLAHTLTGIEPTHGDRHSLLQAA